MEKLVLCCSAGMSTTLFVSRMKKYAKETNLAIDIMEMSLSDIDTHTYQSVSAYILAPQLRFQQKKIEERTNKPVYVISADDYSLIHVQNIFPAVLKMVNKEV
ncbi:MAG: PTS sugar transporter subunit IIB [Brevinema sp.]